MTDSASMRPPLFPALAVPLAAIYRRVIERRNRRFDSGKGVITLDRPVISIGNLSVGGTGKTPMTAAVARLLEQAGHTPCIALRGYKSARTGGSDEQAVHEIDMPDVPVIADPDRAEALMRFFATDVGEAVTCVILDDGFQHRRLARQFDLVLLDATRSPFEDALLPAGWLREPTTSLRRAHAAVVTHAKSVPSETVAEIARQVAAAAPDLLIATARHEWNGLRTREGDRPTHWLAGKRIVVACAIGNPGPFITACERHAGRIVARIVRPDHDAFRPRIVSQIIEAARSADAILCTEKDWAKLSRVDPARWPCDVVRPRLLLAFDAAWNTIAAHISTIASTPVDE